jgi:hypothetical protein
MLILLAASTSVLDFAWYKFVGKRKAQFNNHHKDLDLELESGEVYGLKPLRGGNYQLIESSDLKTVFKLSTVEVKNIIKRSKTFKGKVKGRSVKNSLRGASAGQDTNNSLPKGEGVDRIEVAISDLAHPGENKALTVKLLKVKYPGMSKLTFIQAREMLPGEVYFYYDAASTLRSYRRRKGLGINKYGSWATELDREVEKQIKGIDVEIGSVSMNGKLRHLLVVVDT